MGRHHRLRRRRHRPLRPRHARGRDHRRPAGQRSRHPRCRPRRADPSCPGPAGRRRRFDVRRRRGDRLGRGPRRRRHQPQPRGLRRRCGVPQRAELRPGTRRGGGRRRRERGAPGQPDRLPRRRPRRDHRGVGDPRRHPGPVLHLGPLRRPGRPGRRRDRPVSRPGVLLQPGRRPDRSFGLRLSVGDVHGRAPRERGRRPAPLRPSRPHPGGRAISAAGDRRRPRPPRPRPGIRRRSRRPPGGHRPGQLLRHPLCRHRAGSARRRRRQLPGHRGRRAGGSPGFRARPGRRCLARRADRGRGRHPDGPGVLAGRCRRRDLLLR